MIIPTPLPKNSGLSVLNSVRLKREVVLLLPKMVPKKLLAVPKKIPKKQTRVPKK